MRRSIVLFTAAVAILSLSACSDVKQELGVGRNSPDEFMVVKRAPLTLPPDYDLRPPMQGAPPLSSETSTQAQTALLGSSAAANTAPQGTAEQEFLKKAGADQANPNIRSIISQENGYLALKNEKLVDKLIFWNDEQPSEANLPDSVVNPEAEAERIKKNQEEGKPINSGDVPVIQHETGAFGKIF